MRRALPALVAAVLPMAAARVSAQSLADRIAAVHDGVVHMSFASRPDVCSDGRGSIWTTRGSYIGDGNRVCVHGPVHVTLGRADNQTISVRTRVADRWNTASSETDLGEVSSKEAARYLTTLAHTVGGHSGDQAIVAAVFADDFDPSPDLRLLVRDENAPMDSRRQALFWLGQSDAPTRDLIALYERLTPFSLREHFTFVLSQRHDTESVDKLIDIAQHDRDMEIRKRAMFWLGQSRDPKAIKFFRDVLTR